MHITGDKIIIGTGDIELIAVAQTLGVRVVERLDPGITQTEIQCRRNQPANTASRGAEYVTRTIIDLHIETAETVFVRTGKILLATPLAIQQRLQPGIQG